MLHYAIQGFETGAVERVTRGPSKPPFLWVTDPVGFIISEALWVGGAAISLWVMVAALLIFATGRFPRNKSRGRSPSEYTEDPKLIFLGMSNALSSHTASAPFQTLRVKMPAPVSSHSFFVSNALFFSTCVMVGEMCSVIER